MATFRPFRGYRPLPGLAAQVAARPYDVLSSEEARAEASGNPLSFLHVGKPEIDLPPDVNHYDDAVYEKGRQNLRALIADGILKKDPQQCFYLYAQSMGKHTQFGIVGCASVREYLDNTIRKHELTRREKEDDRTKHVKVTGAHTGPIFLVHRADSAVDAIVQRAGTKSPATDFIASDGIRHQLWVIDDETTIGRIGKAFSGIPHLYVADGHHRSAAAARVGSEMASSDPHHTGTEEYNFFLAVAFPHDQLRIMDYNRIVKDLNGKNPESFLADLRSSFNVGEEQAAVRPAAKGEFGMYMGRKWYRLRAHPSLLATTDPVERLDVSVLQTHLLGGILGIDDPRTNKRIDFVGGIRGLEELERRVDSGEMTVAFSLFPTSIDELMAIADAGKVMPPKSTWFEPKLRDGMVVHMLSDE